MTEKKSKKVRSSMLLDKRLIDRNMRAGLLSDDEYKQALDKLADQAKGSEIVTVIEPGAPRR